MAVANLSNRSSEDLSTSRLGEFVDEEDSLKLTEGSYIRSNFSRNLLRELGFLLFGKFITGSFKNDKGEWENETSFVDCIAWRQMAEDAAGVLEKGIRVVATGRFEQRFWDNADTGKKQSKWQFVVDEVAISTRVIESLVRKRRGDAEGSRSAAGGRQQQSGGAARAASAARRPAPSSNDEEW